MCFSVRDVSGGICIFIAFCIFESFKAVWLGLNMITEAIQELAGRNKAEREPKAKRNTRLN